jgi:hypothetical protein
VVKWNKRQDFIIVEVVLISLFTIIKENAKIQKVLEVIKMVCIDDFQEQEQDIDNHILSAYKLWFNELTFYLESEEVSRLTQEDLINNFCEQAKNRLTELNIKII